MCCRLGKLGFNVPNLVNTNCVVLAVISSRYSNIDFDFDIRIRAPPKSSNLFTRHGHVRHVHFHDHGHGYRHELRRDADCNGTRHGRHGYGRWLQDLRECTPYLKAHKTLLMLPISADAVELEHHRRV
jgi:hypothetical protein